ncbi:MAG: aminomethyl-transferring glycine dehydrogenase [Chloroflexi bacterium]|nr:MAG: aminomethyl-transferring glycine dehydrogenase subunit GcvPA [SAR202 cluster bacterium]KAA1299113.1 MAG: aminomethyl-transferring glycine dehydrogenase subunit GcvPA [SAR202 cluster bacterium]MAX11950.1 aminomethyl-transferring glycine dehydrogenase [Chloroflexota bacterium]|tara:strand:+ start:7432 stop:8742 length:1311 start_codon:yes stop_codon:yes gene_type:complete
MTSSPYIPSTDNDRKEMIEAIGVKNFEGLLTDIPKNFLFPELKLQDKLSEPELVEYFTELGNKNVASKIKTSFLGGGSYNHYIPSTVKAMIQRGEFLTAYTPYQPEASQGTLQVGFEFQSMIAQLFEMDVCNAGMYDGPTALAEAALMACRIKRNNKIVIHESVSEKLLDVLKSYSKWQDIEIIHADQINISKEEDLACLLVQSPDKNGEIIDVESFSDQIHEKNGLLIQHTYPTSLGLLKPPGSLNVDIATAEGQSLGVPLSFGGPYIGLLTCKNEYIRQLPGRIIGQTVDKNGKISFALTLQTREQHIRRESATSNICTSTQLIGLMVAVYVSTMGPHGIKHIAETCFHRAHYMAKKIDQIEGFNLLSKEFFNEFVIQTDISVSKINSFLLENDIEGGIDISANGKNLIMLAVTELNSPSNIEETLNLLGGLSE